MIGTQLSISDWIVFLLTLFFTLLVVVLGNNLRNKLLLGKDYNKTIEHLLMGRSLTMPMFVATLVATWYGGIFGVTQLAFEKGLFNFLTQGVFWYLSYIIFAFFIVPKISTFKDACTLPDILRQKFGPKSEFIGAIFNLFDIIPVAYVISIGLFVSLITGLAFKISMLIGLCFAVIYSLFGGFRAIVFSDIFQFIIMFVSVILVVLFSQTKYGGYQFLKQNLPDSHWSFIGEDLSQTFIWGFIALSTLVNPNFYHRCFAAKSSTVAKQGILWSTLFWMIFDICTTLGGMYARAINQNQDAKYAYINYSIALLPSPLKGLFLAGILATILSTLDSNLFMGGATLANNILPKKLNTNSTTHYISIIFVALIAFCLSLYFEGNIYIVWKTIGSYSSACLLLPLICSFIIPKLTDDNGFVLSCLSGVLCLSLWKIQPIENYGFIDEFYLGVFGSFIGLVGQKLIRQFFLLK